MKKLFKKMKSYSFWLSFSGALIILLNALGKAFGFSIESKVVEECIMAFAGVLVVLGIVTMDIKDKSKDDDNQDDNCE